MVVRLHPSWLKKKRCMELNGWLKLHRKFLEWEWYTDTNVKVVFLHLLLTANHEDKRWMGNVVKRGQKVTSFEGLAAQLGLSVRNVRTAIDKLERTGEITRKTTNKFSVITICKYEDYQQNENDNRHATDMQPTCNRQTNDNKQEYKNERIIYDDDVTRVRVCACEARPIEDFMNELRVEQIWIESICMNNKLSLDEFDKKVNEFVAECKCNGSEMALDIKEAKSHFQNWLRIRLNAEKKEKQDANGNNRNTNENPAERIARLLQGDIRN